MWGGRRRQRRADRVLAALLLHQHLGLDRATGLSLSEAAGLGPGAILPTMYALEDYGYVASMWQERQAGEDPGRPRWRLYYLTPSGEAYAEQQITGRLRKWGATDAGVS